LCAAASTQEVDKFTELLLATSPEVYSSTNQTQVGAVQLVAAARDQGDCQACTAFAVASAAETAMAAALQVPVHQCSISVQGLFFCPAPDLLINSCNTGWTFRDALQQLQERSSTIPTSECLPYIVDITGQKHSSEMCRGRCNAANVHASKGSFTVRRITQVWLAQQHIRQHGAVVTRFDRHSGELG
jgi:hypothetical protein